MESKEYNIGIGVSLGNKWFTVENIVELAKWALPYTRERVIVYVADSIHAINVEVRNHTSFENARKKVIKAGKELLEKIRESLEEELSQGDAARVAYLQWDAIETEEYKRKVMILKAIYEEKADFRKAITDIVRNFTSKETKSFTESDIARLGDYIIAELPEILNRVPMGGFSCDAYAYPFDGELPVLNEKIQKGEVFREVKDAVMDTEPKVFLEVR